MEADDYNPSIKRLIGSRWTATVASIWIQCTSGSLYTFGIYSAALKSSQQYDQSQLDTVTVFKDFGANVGVFAGLVYTSTASRLACGPCLVLFVGAILCFAGYFLMWLTVVGFLPRPPLIIMCLYMLLAAHAMTFFNTANVVTGVHNFPNYSGTIVGIMKGFLGLSGAMLVQVCHTLFKKSTSFLLMLAVLPAANSLLFMGFVRIYQTKEEDERKYLNVFSMVAMILAAYLMAIIIIENVVTLHWPVRILTFSTLIVLLLSPLIILIRVHREKSFRNVRLLLEQNKIMDERKIVEGPTDYHELPGSSDQEVGRNGYATLQSEESLNLRQAMCTISFWLLFLTSACGMGTGLTTVNNISQIGGSLGYRNLAIRTLVSLWSIWNFLGRFGGGYISDYFLRTKGWPRPLFIVITLAAMSIGYVVIATGLPGTLYTGSVLVGICYGSQWSLMPTIASELFGTGHLGTIFNTITIAAPVGTYVFSVKVVGYIYDKEASGKGKSCVGTHCFMLSFLIMAATAFLGSLAALALFFRTRNFYRQIVLRKLALY